MKEDFLHYVWSYKLFSSKELLSTNGLPISILKSGLHNKNSGPDFLNAQLLIGEQLWVGNVEIHLKSSDWYVHNHETDFNYDAVILHVVFEDDVVVFMKNNKPLPTLELKTKISKKVLNNYQNLSSNTKNWIPCEKNIHTVDRFLMHNWMERLYLERLEDKSEFIKSLLIKSDNNYEAVLFQLLAKNFGLKVNANAFLDLAQSLDFSIIRKERFDEYKFSALLFGQAGFLEEEIENEYHKQLKNEYNYLQHKYKLKALPKHKFQFFRMRPNNFPTIRIAQLVALYVKHQNLFSKLTTLTKIEDFYTLFFIEVNTFWKHHYTFETTSKTTNKKLTKSFINLLIINTIIPLIFIYNKEKGKASVENVINLIQQLPSEKNKIISQFLELKITTKNALESQALLQLKNNYCALKKCLKCVIGNDLLLK